MISCKKFCNYMSKIEATFEKEDGFNNWLETNGEGCAFIYSTEIDTMIKMISDLVEVKEDDNPGISEFGNIIEFFIYELGFGKRYYSGCFTLNGEDIDLSDAEHLYDYILMSKKIKE